MRKNEKIDSILLYFLGLVYPACLRFSPPLEAPHGIFLKLRPSPSLSHAFISWSLVFVRYCIILYCLYPTAGPPDGIGCKVPIWWKMHNSRKKWETEKSFCPFAVAGRLRQRMAVWWSIRCCIKQLFVVAKAKHVYFITENSTIAILCDNNLVVCLRWLSQTTRRTFGWQCKYASHLCLGVVTSFC